jgi:hypothetical protein
LSRSAEGGIEKSQIQFKLPAATIAERLAGNKSPRLAVRASGGALGRQSPADYANGLTPTTEKLHTYQAVIRIVKRTLASSIYRRTQGTFYYFSRRAAAEFIKL